MILSYLLNPTTQLSNLYVELKHLRKYGIVIDAEKNFSVSTTETASVGSVLLKIEKNQG